MAKDEIMKTTIRVPKTLWAKVRISAIEKNTSAEAFVVKALRKLLKKGGN